MGNIREMEHLVHLGIPIRFVFKGKLLWRLALEGRSLERPKIFVQNATIFDKFVSVIRLR
jgi:hypothetical protein